MKRLLLTTAIVSSALFAGNAIAQTTITGNLDIGFKAISQEGSGANKMASQRGFGRESQINIQNKGKLSNGMDYAAGFSIEHDGTETGTTANFNENTFIDITSGNTTISISQDHFQNSHRTAANFVGLIAEDITNSDTLIAANKSAADIFLDTVGANPYASYGIGILQNIPNIGSLSALYVPDRTAASSSVANVGDDDGLHDGNGESAYEVGFVGGLGVKGLNTHAFYNKGQKENSAVATDRDTKGTNFGVNYNFGQVTVGYNNKKTTFATVASETKQHEYGVAYAISPAITLGANYTKAKNSLAANGSDAESKSIAVGYNLGPVVLTAQYAKTENVSGVTATTNDDYDVAILRASTKF